MIGPCRIESADGHAVSFVGETFVAVVSRAFAPGTPFRGVVTIEGVDLAIEGRANGSKRTPEGTFEVRARLINLRKADRERLEAASRGA
jgi:hypothetical protein